MIDFSKWSNKPMKVHGLVLDVKNPRLPEARAGASQRELIEELIEQEDVLSLAKSIAEQGYFPVEALIATKEDDLTTVLEGNRRLAALKVLHDPTLAPESHRRRFKMLSERAPLKNLEQVSVLIAPSRNAAAPILLQRHTLPQIEKWQPLMRAKFLAQLVKEGVTPQDISREYGLPLGEITDLLQSYQMYSVACALKLPASVMEKVKNPRKFPISTLERLYRSPKGLTTLGVAFGNDKELIGQVEKEEFKKAFTKLVCDVASDVVDSRQLNSAKDIDKYLATFGTEAANTSKKGTFTAEEVISEGAPPAPPKAVPKPKAPKKQPPMKTMLPRSVRCTVTNLRINEVFNELKKLSPEKYSNACSVLFRSILDMSVSEYMARTNQIAACIASVNKKQKAPKPKDWHPTLKQMITFMLNTDPALSFNPNARKAFNKIMSKQNVLSVDTLDLYVHNQFLSPSARELREMGQVLEPVLQLTLN